MMIERKLYKGPSNMDASIYSQLQATSKMPTNHINYAQHIKIVMPPSESILAEPRSPSTNTNGKVWKSTSKELTNSYRNTLTIQQQLGNVGLIMIALSGLLNKSNCKYFRITSSWQRNINCQCTCTTEILAMTFMILSLKIGTDLVQALCIHLLAQSKSLTKSYSWICMSELMDAV